MTNSPKDRQSQDGPITTEQTTKEEFEALDWVPLGGPYMALDDLWKDTTYTILDVPFYPIVPPPEQSSK